MSAATLDREDLRNTVADVFDVDPNDVTDTADFIEDLGLDSLMALEVMLVLEKKYKIKIGESALREVTNLNKAYDLLARKLEAA